MGKVAQILWRGLVGPDHDFVTGYPGFCMEED